MAVEANRTCLQANRSPLLQLQTGIEGSCAARANSGLLLFEAMSFVRRRAGRPKEKLRAINCDYMEQEES
jgi:hypothetical protein